MLNLSRRALMRLLGGLTLSPMAQKAKSSPGFGFRIRTITAGLELDPAGDLSELVVAADFLDHAKERFTSSGYEVQTTRIATQDLSDVVADLGPSASLQLLAEIDSVATSREVLLAIGPLLGSGQEAEFPAWAGELVAATRQLSFSIRVAGSSLGIVPEAARVAAATIATLSRLGGNGEQNFRFAAAANVPPGTPFFPVAYHEGPPSFSLGLESASVVTKAFSGGYGYEKASVRLRNLLVDQLTPLVAIGEQLTGPGAFRFHGIDLSPAPGLDASIGAGIEALTGLPFGSPSTLAACSAVTSALRSAELPSCGYSGLMLPVLEDPVLAARAQEGRFDINDLLLFSSVCGTGLDVVPLPGDCPVETLTRIIDDVAVMALRLDKPLAARLLPIPGKSSGEIARFDNPHLTETAMVMSPM